jgi:hypothetical protein
MSKFRDILKYSILIAIIILTFHQISLILFPLMKTQPLKYSFNESENWFNKNFNDSNWSQENISFNRFYEGKDIFFRTKFFMPLKRNLILYIKVDDCLTDLYINDKKLNYNFSCYDCAHCEGIRLDVSDYVNKGENILAAKIYNVPNTGTFFGFSPELEIRIVYPIQHRRRQVELNIVDSYNTLLVILFLLIGVFIFLIDSQKKFHNFSF